MNRRMKLLYYLGLPACFAVGWWIAELSRGWS